MLDYTPDEWRTLLAREHAAELPQLREMNDLYKKKRKLNYMHPELIKELDGRIQQLVLNWPRLVVDALDERLDVTGFRFADDESAAKDLWSVWKANRLACKSQQAHLDSLIMRRSLLWVGTHEQRDDPRITVESPLQMNCYWDPATGEIRAARKVLNEHDPLTGSLRARYETLLLPNATHWYQLGSNGTWTEYERDEHGLGEVPVAVLANRARTLEPGGDSELDDVMPISDAANKMATDMMVSGEFHAMPRRWALGFEEEDFQDESGNRVSVWRQIAGRIWSTSKTRKDDGAEVGQFPEADLRNFHETIELLARQVAAVGALPPNYLGLVADDAASADAIRSRETRLIKRAERRAVGWSDGYLQMNRLVMRIRDGGWDPRAFQLETLWRDPATPTRAQAADATVKLVTAKIVPIEQAREDLGYTSVQRDRMRQMDEDALNAYRYNDPAGLEGPKLPPLTDTTGAVDG